MRTGTRPRCVKHHFPAGAGSWLYTISTEAASDGFRKVIKGLSKIANDK